MLDISSGRPTLSLTSPDARTGRIVWADNAKALLITLVALGHFAALDQGVKTVVYAFHLPAFLFITGFFLSPAIAKLSFIDFCRKYVFPFARLYLLVTAISILIWWAAVLVLRHHLVSPLDAILNGLYGTQWEGHRFIHKNGAIWYLPFLVCSLTAFYAAIRLPMWGTALLIAAYFLFGAFYSGYPLPWSAAAGGIGLLFISAGFGFRRLAAMPAYAGVFEHGRGGTAAICVGALLLLILLALLNGPTNINTLQLGSNIALYVAAAAAGITAIVAFSALIPRSALADDLSTNSLLIFCIHLYGVKVVNHLHLFSHQPLLRLAFLVVAAVAIVIASMYVSKVLMPWVNKLILRR